VELPTPGAFVLLLAVSTALSILVFSHANRHGSRRATAWGIVAFLFAALGVAAYFGHFWWTRRGRPG
jgi:type VI protein secretion system component VasF